jgi:hypothetical protein
VFSCLILDDCLSGPGNLNYVSGGKVMPAAFSDPGRMRAVEHSRSADSFALRAAASMIVALSLFLWAAVYLMVTAILG